MDPLGEEVHGGGWVFFGRRRGNGVPLADSSDDGGRKSRQTVLDSGNESKFTAVANFHGPSVEPT